MHHAIVSEEVVHENSNRQAAVTALAVVGFLALVLLGIVLAVYAARYIPEAISRIGSSAAYLSIEGSGTEANLEAVPTLPFPEVTTPVATTSVATTTPAPTPIAPAAPKPAPIVGYTTVTTPYPTPGSIQIPSTPNLYGLPNLVATITAVGYVDSRGNFYADSDIEDSDRLAVKFRVTNTGTNASGAWEVEVILPTESDKTFEYSDRQSSLLPGGYIDFVAHLDAGDAEDDDNQRITVTADVDKDVHESNEYDNTDTDYIDVHR